MELEKCLIFARQRAIEWVWVCILVLDLLCDIACMFIRETRRLKYWPSNWGWDFCLQLHFLTFSWVFACVAFILFVLGQLKFRIYLLPFQFQAVVTNTIYQHKCHKFHFAAINFNYKAASVFVRGSLCFCQAIRNMQIELHNALAIFEALAPASLALRL